MRSKYMSSLSIQLDFLSSNPCSSIQFYTLVSAQHLRRMSITRESFSMREYDCIILVRMSWTFLEGESSFCLNSIWVSHLLQVFYFSSCTIRICLVILTIYLSFNCSFYSCFATTPQSAISFHNIIWIAAWW